MGRPEQPGVTDSGPRRAPLAPHRYAPRPRGRRWNGDTMGTGTGDKEAEIAAARLALIGTEFITPRRYAGEVRGSRPTYAPAPVDLGILDYMRTTVDEVVTHTRAASPQAGPTPAAAADVYGWMREHTADLEPEQRLAGETLVYRQSLEHALAMGDETVIRRHPCPGCGCWGLFWRATARKAACINRNCTDDLGRASTWTLAQLAHQHVEQRQISAVRRAT